MGIITSTKQKKVIYIHDLQIVITRLDKRMQTLVILVFIFFKPLLHTNLKNSENLYQRYQLVIVYGLVFVKILIHWCIILSMYL